MFLFAMCHLVRLLFLYSRVIQCRFGLHGRLLVVDSSDDIPPLPVDRTRLELDIYESSLSDSRVNEIMHTMVSTAVHACTRENYGCVSTWLRASLHSDCHFQPTGVLSCRAGFDRPRATKCRRTGLSLWPFSNREVLMALSKRFKLVGPLGRFCLRVSLIIVLAAFV